jgi:hypothetical protein
MNSERENGEPGIESWNIELSAEARRARPPEKGLPGAGGRCPTDPPANTADHAGCKISATNPSSTKTLYRVFLTTPQQQVSDGRVYLKQRLYFVAR